MRKLWRVALLCCVLSVSALSQSTNATLGGTVQDPSGALIPGVTVTARNTGTGIVSTVLTNEAGAYQFASLQPGTYEIRAELTGFQTAVSTGFQLGGAQQARLNFSLKIGTTTTTVDVTSSTDTVLATSSNSIGTVLPDEKLRDLPLAVRDVLGLVASTAGVQSSGGLIANFAGGRVSSVNTTRDGLNVSAGRFEDGAWSITFASPDLVEEVKVVVAPVDAQASRGSAQVAMVTRSGTNQYRGSLFWSNHNSALDANSWFNNFNGVGVSYDNRNQFGGRVGGPILKNRTFFFALFEGQRDLKRQNAAGSTLTAMARQGIFRYFPGVDNANANNANPTVDREGSPVRPANATGELSAIDLFGGCTFNGAPVANCRTYRDPLRPAISSSAYMQETLRRMPLPNEFTAGDGLNTANIRFSRRVQGLDETLGNGPDVNRDQYTLRIDHNFNSRNKLSVIGTREKTWGGSNQSGLRAWPDGFDGLAVKRPDVYSISFTSTLSPTLLNEFRVGRRRSIDLQYAPGNRPDDVGAEALPFVPRAGGVPFRVTGSSWTPFVNYGGFGIWRGHVSPMHSLADDISWMHGTHAFKGGIEFRNTKSTGFGDPAFTPVVTFGAGTSTISGLDGTVYAGLTANAATTARSLLTDLTGSISQVRQSFGITSPSDTTVAGSPTIQNKFYRQHQREMSVYFKDDWKFRRNLTLNLGVHWEYYGQPWEENGLAARVIGNDESALTGITCTSSPGTPGFSSTCNNLTQVQFVGRNSPNPDVLANLKGNDLNNFAPAVGFSWNLPWFGEGKTVVRSGYGINYGGAVRDFIDVDATIGTVPGINLVGSSIANAGLLYTPSTYTSLSNVTLPIPFPAGTPTTVPFVIPTTDRSLSIGTYNRVSPYTQNWNLEIQREVARNTIVEVRYIGTKGSKLWGTLNLNQIDALHRNRELFDAFNAVRAGGESTLLNQMLLGINLGGTGAQTVNGTSWTGAQAVRTNTTTRAALANGNVGAFLNFLNTNTTGTNSSNQGAILRRNGFGENYIVVNPQFAAVSMFNNLGNSTYHALQAQVTRRLAKGFSNSTTFTWSKTMGDGNSDDGGTYRDPSNRALEKSVLGYDRKFQLTSNGTFELPFGTGHYLLGGAPGWVQQVVSQWQLAGVLNLNSGAPLNVTSGAQTISTVGAQPDIVGEFPKSLGKVTRVSNGVIYFDGYTQTQDPGFSRVSSLDGLTAGYSNRAIVSPEGQIVLVNPEPGDVGTLGLNWLRGPGSIRLDLDMIKRFKIRENTEFELRVDAINVLNTPNFGSPNVGINGNNTFGRITTATGARTFVLNTRLNF